MDTEASKKGYLKTLHRLLDEATFDDVHLSESLKELEEKFGDVVYPDSLYHLTRMDFSQEQSRHHIENLLKRHREMSKALGRKVGLRTAVCDYFLSHERMFQEPVVIETRLLVQSEESALLDELTGLHNRRFFNMQLSKELERSRRSQNSFSLLLVDVDYFKRYNDTYGHLAGDSALRQVAALLKTTARHMDHVTRYGGEEFVVILPQAGKEEALQAAERHRKAVEEHQFEYDNLTISIGASTFPEDADHEADLLFRADFALYEAKKCGRNKICDKVEDQRSSVRYEINLPAECRLAESSTNGLKGRTINLSLSGMLYEVAKPIDIGVKLKTSLLDQENRRIPPLDATALRSEPAPDGESFHIGIKFDNDAPADKALRCLINEKMGFSN
jgi:diguanylate cyclase (GGDEF)-like protein